MGERIATAARVVHASRLRSQVVGDTWTACRPAVPEPRDPMREDARRWATHRDPPWGDVAAYAALVGRFQTHAIGLAALVLGGRSDAEDVAQEAFIKAYYARATFRPGGSFRAWLAQIVTNEARNWRASAQRRVLLRRRLEDQGWCAALAPSAEQVALTGEQHDSVLMAVEQLRVDDREILAYRYLLDLSEAEIARALHCAPGTVKSRLSRARGRLRDDLAVRARDLADLRA